MADRQVLIFQKIWGLGNYHKLGAEYQIVSEHLVAEAVIRAGQRILDLASGAGNTAVATARLGAPQASSFAKRKIIQRALAIVMLLVVRRRHWFGLRPRPRGMEVLRWYELVNYISLWNVGAFTCGNKGCAWHRRSANRDTEVESIELPVTSFEARGILDGW